jgi:DNA-binding response OmpR family regulator
MRVLIVEDDPQLGDGLMVGLRQSGFAVDWLKDGEAADRALASEEFDLLVLDLGLPRLAGMELLRRLRTLRKQGRRDSPAPARPSAPARISSQYKERSAERQQQ